jgi:LysR family nitrogen assimilation transcriptional regulator
MDRARLLACVALPGDVSPVAADFRERPVMDLRQIQYFVALYEEKSITKAARRLHVVQPAVSMQIRRIEADYGVTLFERTTSGVYPNQAANTVYPMCLEVLANVEKLRRTLRHGSGKIDGTLNVGVPPSIAHGILAGVLMDFQQRYPDVQIAVSEGYSAHLVDWLLQGDLDFAVLGEFEDDRRLHCEPLAIEELRVLTSTATPVTGDSITGRELQKLKLILPSTKNLIRILIDAEFERAGLTLAPSMEVDSLATVFAAARQPGWASILPAAAISDADLDRGMRSLALVEPAIRRTLVASFPTLKPSSAAAHEFLKALKRAVLEAGGIEILA